MKIINFKKNIVYIVLSIFAVIFLAACSTNENNMQNSIDVNTESNNVESSKLNKEKNQETNNKKDIEYKTITPEEAKKLLDKDENVILLDVRTEEEYLSSHIPGSILLPLDELEDKVENEIQEKETVILVYCRSGNRSKTASNILIDLGYKNVYDLGGIIDWPYDIEANE